MPRKSMVNTAELIQIFPLRKNTLRHVVEGDGRYPRAMTPSADRILWHSTVWSIILKRFKVDETW